MELFRTSSTMTRSPRSSALPHAASLAIDRIEIVEERSVEPSLRRDPQTITLEQLDVAHLSARDLDGRIQNVVEQQPEIACLQQACTHLLHPRHVLEALAQQLLGLLVRCDVVETVDGAGDVAAVVLQRSDIHDDGHARAVRPLDDHFAVARLRQGAGYHFSHRTLFVRHVRAVGTE